MISFRVKVSFRKIVRSRLLFKKIVFKETETTFNLQPAN